MFSQSEMIRYTIHEPIHHHKSIEKELRILLKSVKTYVVQKLYNPPIKISAYFINDINRLKFLDLLTQNLSDEQIASILNITESEVWNFKRIYYLS